MREAKRKKAICTHWKYDKGRKKKVGVTKYKVDPDATLFDVSRSILMSMMGNNRIFIGYEDPDSGLIEFVVRSEIDFDPVEDWDAYILETKKHYYEIELAS
jgi:hypothetical protein